jgi:hypothetical protein
VVAVTLGLAACGGKYDVGTGENAAQAAAAGVGNTGTGGDGSGGSGVGGGSAGGASAGNGVTGGAPSGGFAGAAVGGSSVGGSAGTSSCSVPEVPFPEYQRAAPEVVWDRLCELFHGEPREPLLPLPETTTDDWVREAVRALIDDQTREGLGNSPEGLVTFMRNWAYGGDGAEPARYWLSGWPRGDFGALCDGAAEENEPGEASRVSFMSDRAFLTAHPDSTSRGVWIAQNLVCLEIPLPPPDVEGGPLIVPPNMTRRQAIESAVSQSVCIGCHSAFDPLGFSLENYDELGDYRTTENGLPIDASGTYEMNGISATFDEMGDLAADLVMSCAAAQCFAGKFFQDALARSRPAGTSTIDANELAYVQNRFAEHNTVFSSIFEAVALTPAFLRE